MVDIAMLPGVGVFGTDLSSKALTWLLQSAGFPIEAIWGKTEDEAKELAEETKVPFTTSRIDELLLHQKVDVVCINSPPFLHSQIAVKTLGIGKNVLCDRPAGLEHNDTVKMIEAARYYPSLMSLMTYHMRFLPTFRNMRTLVGEKYLGEILVLEVRVHCDLEKSDRYDWSHDSKMGGGILAMFGSHFVDIVSFISMQKAVSVHGHLRTFKKETDQVNGFREITSDDFCTFTMSLDGNACCTCTLNNNVSGKFFYEVLVTGSEGRLVARDGVLYGSKNGEKEVVIIRDVANNLENIPTEITNLMPPPLFHGMARFVNALRESFLLYDDPRKWDKSQLVSAATFEDALYIQTVLTAIKKSNQSGNWEMVEPNLRLE